MLDILKTLHEVSVRRWIPEPVECNARSRNVHMEHLQDSGKVGFEQQLFRIKPMAYGIVFYDGGDAWSCSGFPGPVPSVLAAKVASMRFRHSAIRSSISSS